MNSAAAAPLPGDMEDIFFLELDEECADPPEEPVFRWRLQQLERAGYDPCSAIELAGRHDVDLHFAVALRTKGCPAATAVRILN